MALPALTVVVVVAADRCVQNTYTFQYLDMSHVPESALSNPPSQNGVQTRSLISLKTHVKHANDRKPSAAVSGTPVATATN